MENVSFEAAVLLSILDSAKKQKNQKFMRVDENGEVYYTISNKFINSWLPFLKKREIAKLFDELVDAGLIRIKVRRAVNTDMTFSTLRYVYIDTESIVDALNWTVFNDMPSSWEDVYVRLGITLLYDKQCREIKFDYIDKEDLYEYIPDELARMIIKSMLNQDLFEITEDEFLFSEKLQSMISDIFMYWVHHHKM